VQVLPQTPLDWVLLAVALATAIIIAVALQDFFLDSRLSSPRIRALQDFGIVIAVSQFGVLLLRGSAGPNWAIAAIAMYVAATLLFLSALEAARRVPLPRTFVSDPPPKALITSGPFMLVRHPFYIAYAIAWMAAPVATHGPIITVLAVIAIVLYAIAARREERQLEERFGEAYRAYKRGAGMVVPSIARLLARQLP
jgi:protein-S-isoprenylcysteine O-methyltransferase Ste14